MRKFKKVILALNVFWDLKELAIRLSIAGLAITLFSIIMKEPFFMTAFLGVLIVMFITLTLTWFKDVKPLIEEAEKEMELESKYEWMLNRFENS